MSTVNNRGELEFKVKLNWTTCRTMEIVESSDNMLVRKVPLCQPFSSEVILKTSRHASLLCESSLS